MVEDWGHWLQVVVGLFMALMFLGIAYRPDLTIYLMILLVTYVTLTQIVWWVGMWYRDKHPYVHKDKPPTPTKKLEPSLLSAWLKARKGKVCPPIMEVRDK